MHRWRSPTQSLTELLARLGLTDLWFRGVAILIPEVLGDLVGRIRIEYSGGLSHRCWMLMVASSFAASVAWIGHDGAGRPMPATREQGAGLERLTGHGLGR